jgi:hypothetical protein
MKAGGQLRLPGRGSSARPLALPGWIRVSVNGIDVFLARNRSQMSFMVTSSDMLRTGALARGRAVLSAPGLLTLLLISP